MVSISAYVMCIPHRQILCVLSVDTMMRAGHVARRTYTHIIYMVQNCGVQVMQRLYWCLPCKPLHYIGWRPVPCGPYKSQRKQHNHNGTSLKRVLLAVRVQYYLYSQHSQDFRSSVLFIVLPVPQCIKGSSTQVFSRGVSQYSENKLYSILRVSSELL